MDIAASLAAVVVTVVGIVVGTVIGAAMGVSNCIEDLDAADAREASAPGPKVPPTMLRAFAHQAHVGLEVAFFAFAGGVKGGAYGAFAIPIVAGAAINAAVHWARAAPKPAPA